MNIFKIINLYSLNIYLILKRKIYKVFSLKLLVFFNIDTLFLFKNNVDKNRNNYLNLLVVKYSILYGNSFFEFN